MAPQSVTPIEAAHLLMQSRKPIVNSGKKLDKSVKVDGKTALEFEDITSDSDKVGAALIKGLNILIITGSRVPDYARYNMRPNRTLSWKKDEQTFIDEIVKPWKLKDFHSGFVLHAARVLKFLKGRKPAFIVGHSLGAASAQILGNHLDVPTICLASPQVVKKRILDKADMRKPENRQWNILNIAWRQDTVTSILRPLKYRCLGHRVIFVQANTGIDHFVSNYLKLFEEDPDNVIIDSRGNRGSLPMKWYSPGLPIKDKP